MRQNYTHPNTINLRGHNYTYALEDTIKYTNLHKQTYTDLHAHIQTELHTRNCTHIHTLTYTQIIKLTYKYTTLTHS